MIVFALAFAYRVIGVYRFRSGECSARPARTIAQSWPPNLKVMTFNIEGHASLLKNDHIAEVAETIRRHNPDIVGINEAHRWTWQSRFDDHIEELQRLTGMHAAFGTSYTFLGGHFGNAVLTRGRIVSVEVHELPGTGEPRSLLETVVEVGGGTVEFYVTHLAAWANLGQKTRDLELQCIADHLRASRFPSIMTGDLNAPADSPEIASFLALGLLRPADDVRTPTHRVLEQHLDYVLTGPGWKTLNASVLDEGPSDHRPVFVELAHEK